MGGRWPRSRDLTPEIFESLYGGSVRCPQLWIVGCALGACAQPGSVSEADGSTGVRQPRRAVLPPTPVLDLESARNITRLRENLTELVGRENESMHVLLWRAGHLVKEAVRGKEMREIMAAFQKQGIPLRVEGPSSLRVRWPADRKYVFVGVPGAYRTESGLVHDLDVHICKKWDIQTAAFRLRGFRKLSELRRAYGEHSIGRAYLTSESLEGQLVSLEPDPLVGRLEFEWETATRVNRRGDLVATGAFVAKRTGENQSGDAITHYRGISLRLDTWSLLMLDQPARFGVSSGVPKRTVPVDELGVFILKRNFRWDVTLTAHEVEGKE